MGDSLVNIIEILLLLFDLPAKFGAVGSLGSLGVTSYTKIRNAKENLYYVSSYFALIFKSLQAITLQQTPQYRHYNHKKSRVRQFKRISSIMRCVRRPTKYFTWVVEFNFVLVQHKNRENV